MYILGFHGQSLGLHRYAAYALNRDIGPASWRTRADKFWQGFNAFEAADYIVGRGESVILVGFSKGCTTIAEVTHHLIMKEMDLIQAAILYEGPFKYVPNTGFNVFPVLVVWNDNGKSKTWRGRRERNLVLKAWSIGNRVVEEMEGRGKHLKTFPVGHDWDQSINEDIGAWLNERI